jgi:hypothetical protein
VSAAQTPAARVERHVVAQVRQSADLAEPGVVLILTTLPAGACWSRRRSCRRCPLALDSGLAQPADEDALTVARLAASSSTLATGRFHVGRGALRAWAVGTRCQASAADEVDWRCFPGITEEPDALLLPAHHACGCPATSKTVDDRALSRGVGILRSVP